MIILEYVVLELLQFLIAKRASMVPVDCFFDAGLTIYMSTSRYVTVVDRIEAYCTLELCLKLFWVYLKVYMVLLLFSDHEMRISGCFVF